MSACPRPLQVAPSAQPVHIERLAHGVRTRDYDGTQPVVELADGESARHHLRLRSVACALQDEGISLDRARESDASHFATGEMGADEFFSKIPQRAIIRADFSETAAAVLTAGCLRLNAVLYRSCKELLLGYDVFVKDDPGSPEWIYYDGLSDPVSLKESDMIRILDRLITERGLSYTESCFKRLDGKTVKK